MKSSAKIEVKAIFEKELYTTPPLVPVIAAKIVGTKSNIPKAFRLTKNLSVNELKHLRRIRDLQDGEIECLLCKIKSNQQPDQKVELKELETKFAQENIFKDYRIVQVPSKAPKTDHQLKACSNIWPCKFAKSNYLNQCLEGTLLNESEKLVIKIIADHVNEYLKLNSSNHKAAAVVFRCAKIHGIGLSSIDHTKQNPLKHSTMISLDSVATNAGAGHWKSHEGDDLLNLIQEELDGQEELKDHRIDAQFLPYLCTNYDIFITEEPCFMCTMGLVQSRIRRLFYLDTESPVKLTNCEKVCFPDGAIEDCILHRDKNLNHRFEAWKVTLLPEQDEYSKAESPK